MQKLSDLEEKRLLISLSDKDINLIFKYLGRAELKGLEVPEFNSIISIFENAEIKKVNPTTNQTSTPGS